MYSKRLTQPTAMFSSTFPSKCSPRPREGLRLSKLVQIAGALAYGLYACSCATLPTQTQVKARNNGAIIVFNGALANDGTFHHWEGGIDANGFASGQGVLTFFGPDGKRTQTTECNHTAGVSNGPYTMAYYSGGERTGVKTGTFKNNRGVGESEYFNFKPETPDALVYQKDYADINSKIHGSRVRKWNDGSMWLTTYEHGVLQHTTKYNADGTVKADPVSQSQSYASSSSDDDFTSGLLGSMMAIGGASVGDAMMTNAGITAMQGDLMGASQQLMNSATTGGSGSGTSYLPQSGSGSQLGTQAAKPEKKIAHRDDLINQYGLRKYENSDHIQYYIKAADRALADYRKTGEANYYTRHEHYADTALQFHKQTSTKGTRMIN